MGDLIAFGHRLREERVRKGLNQTDMASLGGVSRNSQTAYETGASTAGAAYLLALSEAGVDVGYVVTGTRSVSNLDAWQADIVTAFADLENREKEALHTLLAGLTARARAPSVARSSMPPQPALAEMFEAFLEVYPDLHGAELAQALARHLPTGLARLADIGPTVDRLSPPEIEAQPDQRVGRPEPRQARRT